MEDDLTVQIWCSAGLVLHCTRVSLIFLVIENFAIKSQSPQCGISENVPLHFVAIYFPRRGCCGLGTPRLNFIQHTPPPPQELLNFPV